MIREVAYLAMHSSPLEQPGVGNAGGMNVYVDELARTMAGRGIDCVVFTRRTHLGQPVAVQPQPGYRVVHVDAGPTHSLRIGDQAGLVGSFADGTVAWALSEGAAFDIIHSHYWLGGWAGVQVKEALGAPLVNSFHTLGRVKDAAHTGDEPWSHPIRLRTEEEVMAQSDCVVAATAYEFDDLLEHYGATPEQLRVSPPGVDHRVFSPGDRRAARDALGLGDEPVVLFVGRIQRHKGIDTAVHAVADLAPATLLIVGGPSGDDGRSELAYLIDLTQRLGLGDRVRFVPPVPHDRLVAFYRAADVLVMPSRSESFGLVAVEAQACGLPVVASRVGGLASTVADAESGLLVDGHDPASFGAALAAILDHPEFRERLSRGAVHYASGYSWDRTADRLLEVYRELE